jgi:F-type H+-transporting ATPase subunit delta
VSQAAQKKTPNVQELQVARVYAEAVWNLAVQQGQQAEFLEEYDSLLKDVLDAEPQLEIFFGLGSISEDRKSALIDSIFKGRASDLLYHFLKTLNAHDRLGLLRAVGVCLHQLQDAALGRVPVLIKSAVPLSSDQLQAVEAMLTQKLNITPRTETEVDPELLGGLWIRVGDMVYDRTVRWNLNQLRENILARSSHEIQSGRDIVDRSEGN